MDKTIINNVITAVVTAVVLGIGAFFMGVFETGTKAAQEAQIKTVIEAMLVTDNGKTYKARIAEVNVELATIDLRLARAQGDLADLEDAVFDLASD